MRRICPILCAGCWHQLGLECPPRGARIPGAVSMAGFLSRSLPASLVWLSHWSSFKSEAGSGAASHVQQTVAVCKPNAWPRVPLCALATHHPHAAALINCLAACLPLLAAAMQRRSPTAFPTTTQHSLAPIFTDPASCLPPLQVCGDSHSPHLLPQQPAGGRAHLVARVPQARRRVGSSG